MAEEQKAKRKYTRKPKVEPLAVYAVLVTVKRGKKVETIYCESTRIENGCLVVVSMDGPQPLVEKTRYIPLGDGEITVCARPRPVQQGLLFNPATTTYPIAPTNLYVGGTGAPNPQLSFTTSNADGTSSYPTGPRIEPGPLSLVRERPAGPRPTAPVVERNGEGVVVASAAFGDGGQ